MNENKDNKDNIERLKKLSKVSSKKSSVDVTSNKWVNAIASIVLLIVGTVGAIVLERMGDLQSELGSMSEAVSRVEELEHIKERIVKLEIGGQIISHAQLSISKSQYPTLEGNFLKMDLVDSIEGSIEFDPRRNATSIKILEDGSYLLLIVPQIRRLLDFTGEACLTTWLVINGQDLANSSIKNCLTSENWRDTLTSTLQTILPMNKGETIQVKMRSQPDGRVGMVAISPEGVPLVPAAIVSLVRIGG